MDGIGIFCLKYRLFPFIFVNKFKIRTCELKMDGLNTTVYLML
jgi:hypothetical protein